MISNFESLMNFQLKEKKLVDIGPQTRKLDFGGSESFEVNFNIGFGIPIEFPSKKNVVRIEGRTE